MRHYRKMLGFVLPILAGLVVAACAPSPAAADDQRLNIRPAVYRSDDTAAAAAKIELVGWRRGAGYHAWGPGWGYRGYYRPYGYYYGGYPAYRYYGYPVSPYYGYGYGYPAYGYGYGYPAYGFYSYGYPAYGVGIGVW